MKDGREHFHQELHKLNDLILKMGAMVEKAIYNSVDALKKNNPKIAGEVIAADDQVDQLELTVDDLCLELLATQQPMAVDLRFITTGMRIGSDLERIGDLAVDIAQRAVELSTQPLLKPLEDIPKMAELAEKMVHKALDSFVKRDAALARSLWADEEKADGYRDLVTDELTAIIARDASTTARALPLILIARHLERIADHATNIAEDVVYMAEGKVIKHGPRQV
ncbi:MAG: phosphate signaling complex protein PhoU [Candidatus Margulisbacteria bacterium]|jgi:phosphate transport system protein|nr:phosphate signaling complex protein PhoU [Candidatus Margulisiibacteriota bacterium]